MATFGFLNFGPTELLVILAIVLVIFGPRKLPELGRSIGEMLSGLRKGINGTKGEDKPRPQTEEKSVDDGTQQPGQR